MKKYLFLSILVFCIMLGFLGNNTISVSLHLTDQDEDSKTKENTEIYTSNTLSDTKEAKIEEATQDTIQNVEKNIEINEPKEQTIQNTEKKIEEKQTKKDEENKKNSSQNQKEEKNETQKIEEKKSIYEFLKFSSDVSYDNIKTAENEISKLPKKLVDSFIKEKWTIEITNDNLSKKFFNGAYKSVIGVTVTASKKIYVQNKKSSIQSSLIHEFGHYIDWYFNYPSAYNELRQIYNEEGNTFKSRITNASCVSNEMEFFAQMFYYYIKDESKCTPKALELIRKYVNEIENRAM